MNLSLSLCLIFVSFGVLKAEKWNCNQKSSERKLDEFMSKLLVFGTNRTYPEIKSQRKEYCVENYKLIKQIDDYNKQCLKDIAKQSVGLIMYSIKGVIDSYCKKNSKYANTVMVAAPCANKATKEFNKCHIEYIDALIVSKGNLNKKGTVPSICCQYHKIFECVHKAGKTVDGCTDRILDISEDFIKAHFDRVFGLLCADYGATTDVCDKVNNLPRIPNKDKKKRPKTFILPLVNLLKDI